MIGQQILHYKILEKLGEGGMGVVYLAEDSKLKRKVAIKFLPGRIAANHEEKERFKIEAQAAAALNHPNIGTIYAIEEIDDEIFIVMEYIEGKELRELIKSKIPNLKSAIDYATQIAEGLKAAHRKGIIHRDIKSSNIMVTESGQVKIMDFGLAKVTGEGAQLSRKHSTLGTAAYMSPEQARGDPLDHRTDIWSFGVVLYEMLTGKLPFDAEYEQAIIYSVLNEEPDSLVSLRPEIPEKIRIMILRMLEKIPDRRFSNLENVLTELANLSQIEQEHSETIGASIAVLPFADISPARDQDYFCEGIAEEILITLGKIKGLRVASHTSSFQFKERNKDIREIGRLLNVKSVLEGSVRKAGNILRINVQLTDVSSGFYLWSDRFDRELNDVFMIQENIAEQVARELRGVLTPKEKEAIRRPGTAIEAYEYFLKGRQFLNQFAMQKSKEMFEKAIEQDPEYAPAYAGLADVHSWLYEWWGAQKKDLESANSNSRKALDLAPQLAESHISRGYVLALGRQYEEAEKEFQDALLLDPNAFEAYYYHGRACFARGEIERSAELFRKAGEVRREDFQSVSLQAQSLYKLGRSGEAEEANRECIRRVERQLELDPANRRALSLGAIALFNEGQRERSFEWLEKGMKLYPDDTGMQFNAACLLARAGRKDECLDLLEKVFGRGYGKRDWIENDPDYDSVRDDPRFQSLLKKLK